jgi:tRNA 2-thiouridine synthesizing protein A
MANDDSSLTAAWQLAEAIDLSGLKCPMPALMTTRALRRVNSGDLIAVTVTDPMAPLDLRHLCQRDGHVLVDERPNENGARRFLIRRGPRSD